MKSITEILGTLPSGNPGPTLDASQLGAYLRQHCDTDELRERGKRHALQKELYKNGGDQKMRSLLDSWVEDANSRDLRKAFVEVTKFNNVSQRIAHALATVYNEDAKRSVDGDENNAHYQQLLADVGMDAVMLRVSRLLCLHRVLLVGFRVRENIYGEREPVLDVVTPASARPVLHPNDSSMIVGWLIRSDCRPAGDRKAHAWTLWSAAESMQLDEDMRPIEGSYETHSFGVVPWVPVTFEAEWETPGHEGADITAAHLLTWFQGILLAKESKSATKTTTASGDTSRVARGQALDTENVVELGEGVSMSTLDTSMDLGLFTSAAEHVTRTTALNYGLPVEVLEHRGTQSAEARELLMMPLKELRAQMQLPLRRFEKRLARVMSAICAVDAPDYAFDASTWRMEFADVSTPLDRMTQFSLFEKYRAAGLKNTVEFLMELRPGLTFEQAEQIIRANIDAELLRNIWMRPLQQVSGSTGATLPPSAGTAAEAAAA